MLRGLDNITCLTSPYVRAPTLMARFRHSLRLGALRKEDFQSFVNHHLKMDIPLKFFPATSANENAKKAPVQLDGMLTVPRSKNTEEGSEVAILLLHGSAGDLHSGHMAGPLT